MDSGGWDRNLDTRPVLLFSAKKNQRHMWEWKCEIYVKYILCIYRSLIRIYISSFMYVRAINIKKTKVISSSCSPHDRECWPNISFAPVRFSSLDMCPWKIALKRHFFIIWSSIFNEVAVPDAPCPHGHDKRPLVGGDNPRNQAKYIIIKWVASSVNV